jgi:SAM-dependent methyltransferase
MQNFELDKNGDCGRPLRVSTDDLAGGPVSASAAEVYEQFFVPALYAQWARKVADVAQISSGEKVLDVACGTGVLAREAAVRGATVTGLDVSMAMLAVAGRLSPDIVWRHGTAEALPFGPEEFNLVVSQFGLMYVVDRIGAVREMLRVLDGSGRLAVALCDADSSPTFEALIALVRRLFGGKAADALPAPFLVGTPRQVEALFTAAGASNVDVRMHPGTATFRSLRDWLFTEIRGWTLADLIDERQFDLLVKEAAYQLADAVAPDGHVVFDSPAYIVTATRG